MTCEYLNNLVKRTPLAGTEDPVKRPMRIGGDMPTGTDGSETMDAIAKRVREWNYPVK